MGKDHPISQPKLGQRLYDIRMERGYTQLELREKSHVSVRTIQRIESGAVTPRTVTIKILLEALGEDLEAWYSTRSSHQDRLSLVRIKNLLLFKADESALREAMAPAWMAGIVYLLMVLLEEGLAAFSEYLNDDYWLFGSLIIIKLLAAVSFFLFTRGLLSLSLLFENYVLKIACYLSMLFVPAMYLSEVIIISLTQRMDGLVDTFRAISVIPLGAISIILGIGLRRLQDGMGRLAKVAGNLELVFGISYLSLVFSFVGFLLLIPLLVVEVVLLAKADDLVRNEQI
ncbi:MAG: transcriptional regulator with XRE-family HTH domain [Cyclobacteriaceae bacterium]|jgi:transcriptional regulator with XRE-family HTH domain